MEEYSWMYYLIVIWGAASIAVNTMRFVDWLDKPGKRRTAGRRGRRPLRMD